MKKIDIKKRCEVSGCKGELICTGAGFSNSLGSYWLHRCTLCNAEKYLDAGVSYPYSLYEYEPHELETRWE